MLNVSVIITDLDNTLFDWVDIWFHSFSALVDRIERDSNIEREQLLNEIKAVHQRRGTSEYAFLIEEIPSLRSQHPNGDLLEIYQPAIDDFRAAREKHLKLYPAVSETLKKLKRKGVLIVGYTESMAFYSNYRIRKLGLDGLLDYIYSPPDHELPNNLTAEQIRKYPASHYTLKITEHRHTPPGEIKPNPDILASIIEDIGAKADQCLYVGDSLMKDIAMAQRAGVRDAYALYGKAQHLPAYELLRRVTHWPLEQVEQEKVTVQTGSVRPTCTLTSSFSEILAFFEFSPSSNGLGKEYISNVITIWQKTIDVQQHFNDIEMKIRNAAVTVMAALLGATGFALKEHLGLSIGPISLPIATLLLFTALLSWGAFYFMDRHWYHRLLIGAVKHGETIENSIKGTVPEIGLTKSISAASPAKLFCFEIHSTRKIQVFYGTVAACIAIFCILSLFLTENPPPLHGNTSSQTQTLVPPHP